MHLNIEDIRDKLPNSGSYPQRHVSDITHIDLHHSASLSSNYKGYQTVEGFANYHITPKPDGNGWPGLGYHYVVAPDGKIWKTGYANESRWSVGNHNGYSISLMIIGSFDKENPTQIQYDSAVELASRMGNAYAVPQRNIMGHNEYSGHAANACPGINMGDFRTAVRLFQV